LNTPAHRLQELGFSQYEAQAYVALLQHNPLNGYELAKASSVPRANIYHVLDKLEERGAVARLEAQGSTRFVPIQPEELFRGMRARLQTNLNEAQESLCSLHMGGEPQQVLNLTGYSNLLDQAGALAAETRESLIMAVSPQEAESLAAYLGEAQKRGVEITTLCLAGCSHECGSCHGKIYRYHVTPDVEMRSLLLVKDQNEVLAGEIGTGGSTQGVRTRQRLLVNLAANHIRDSIALSAIVLDLGEELENLLGTKARQVLLDINPGKNRAGWLDQMRELLAAPGQKN
jgi:DNA-binding MarR family transcriptional regulator